jgi:hypothetical protein
VETWKCNTLERGWSVGQMVQFVPSNTKRIIVLDGTNW